MIDCKSQAREWSMDFESERVFGERRAYLINKSELELAKGDTVIEFVWLKLVEDATTNLRQQSYGTQYCIAPRHL